MSVYTPQQISQPQSQQPYGQQMSGQPLWGLQSQNQQPFGQQGQGQFGQQQPFGQQGQGQQQLPLLVTELSLRCSATAVSAVVEQLRMDPQILMGIQAQGQIPPHAFSQVLTECARRIAPLVHTALAQITGQGQSGQMSQFGQGGMGQFGQFPGQQPQGQMGQFGQLQGLGQGQGLFGQPQYGQWSGLGM
ncbi:hypothetical protein ACFVZH_40035 [Streptomyces sp. NPDC059534]|uniref:hypothetical protein n=1 Tax=Streptomyces sp. NPDC059534 TaxID=3346859 RepID=UPI0036CBCD96